MAHDLLHLKRSPRTTLLLDLGMGTLMAGGTLVRRMRRARMYDTDDHLLNAVKKAEDGTALSVQARTAAVATATAVGSTLGLAHSRSPSKQGRG